MKKSELQQIIREEIKNTLPKSKNKLSDKFKDVNESLPDTFLGMPLETFSDYYQALGVALELGLTAAVAASVLGMLGIRKGIELFKKGKEAVMAWYERNKLNEQEDVQSKTKMKKSELQQIIREELQLIREAKEAKEQKPMEDVVKATNISSLEKAIKNIKASLEKEGYSATKIKAYINTLVKGAM